MQKEKQMMEAQIMKKQGFKQWEIAKSLKVTDRTVRNYLKGPPSPRKKVERESKLDRFKQFIKSIITEKPWYNCMVLIDRLRGMGYTGQISILRDYVADVRRKILQEAIIRFETEPGYQAQVDWKDFGKQKVNGVMQKLYAFVMVLGYSRKAYVCFTTSMKQNIFLWCHMRAFKYFGGIPREILYDNMKTAFSCTIDGEFYPNRKLLAFAHHYGFTPKRCMIYRPQTKGKVERFIEYVEDNFWLRCDAEEFFVDSLDEYVITWLENIDRKKLRDFNESREDRFSREKAQLKALPADDFDCREEIPCIVDRESCITIESNRYSVPPCYIGDKITVLVDVLHKNAYISISDGFKREFSLFPKGKRLKTIYPEDKKEIYRMWKKQREKRMANIKMRKSSARKADQDVDTRPPSVYERYRWEAA